MEYGEDHLDEVCGAFLPGCHWCVGLKLVREGSSLGCSRGMTRDGLNLAFVRA
jgi:hypothetical protein